MASYTTRNPFDRSSATNRRAQVGRLIMQAIERAQTAGLDAGSTADAVVNHLASHGHLPAEWSDVLARECTHCGAEAFEPCVNAVDPNSFEADEFGARWAITHPHDARLTPRRTMMQALRDRVEPSPHFCVNPLKCDTCSPQTQSEVRTWLLVDADGNPTGRSALTSNPDGPSQNPDALMGTRWVLPEDTAAARMADVDVRGRALHVLADVLLRSLDEDGLPPAGSIARVAMLEPLLTIRDRFPGWDDV